MLLKTKGLSSDLTKSDRDESVEEITLNECALYRLLFTFFINILIISPCVKKSIWKIANCN